ncbi:hypothetical protein N7540_001121, partial [Penicillium herquei]
SRAEHNKVLRIIFGIINAFTSHDPQLVKAFVDDARRRIKLKPDKWSKLTPMLVEAAREWIFVGVDTDRMENGLRGSAQSKQPGRFNITSLVQVVTLRAILATVLKVEAKNCPSNLDLLNLAQQINQGWIESKKCNRPGMDGPGFPDVLDFEHNKAIQANLQAVFPHQTEYGPNPLNILLTSFETMWRVLLRALLELNFQRSHENPEWAKTMISFCSNVTKVEFERRLSPPVLCILLLGGFTGVFVGDSPASCELESVYIAADIEGCHLRADIWGSDAANFDPAR